MKRLQDMDLSKLVHWASLKVLKGIFTGTLESEIHYVVDTMLDLGRERHIAKLEADGIAGKRNLVYHQVMDEGDIYFVTSKIGIVLTQEADRSDRQMLGTVHSDGVAWTARNLGGEVIGAVSFPGAHLAEAAVRARSR